MPDETYDIQELVKASGVARRTIYFYVQQGLLPAPEGAGLAAYYTREHLLRLQTIPLLRQQGLRLDEIRQRFAQMPLAEMEQLVENQAAASVAEARADYLPMQELPTLLPPISAPSPVPSTAPQPGRAPQPRPGPGLPAERRFVHYQLPAGISLVAPADLSQSEQVRLRLLLQAAVNIFNEQPGFRHIDGNSGPSDPQANQQA